MSFINGVNLLPSTGEFTYATTAHRGQRITEPSLSGINFYQGSTSYTDFKIAIDQLQAAFPACTTVAVICAWFGDTTDASTCKIYPSTTYGAGSFRKWNGSSWVSTNWQCSSLTQGSIFSLIPITSVNGIFVYGGTPSDQSIVECITELKARALRVVFYPFILMDAPGKPWRGRITYSPDVSTAAASAVSTFLGSAAPANFTRDTVNKTVSYSGSVTDYTYRRMILHYANLCIIAGGVDLFVIGSELRGLETIRGPAWTKAGTVDGGGKAVWDYPFVDGLITLADDVRGILDGAGYTKNLTTFKNLISYAADWSDWMGYQHPGEYGQWPHLDRLWAHGNIDLVAFDNYLPISDWTTGTGGLDVLNWTKPRPKSWPPSTGEMSGLGLTGTPTIYSKEYFKANIEGGEKFNWFYFDSEHLGRGLDPKGSDLQVSRPQGDRLAQSRNRFFPNQEILGNKQLRWWWKNIHKAVYDTGSGFEPQGPDTQWVAQSKSIVFTEYGYPANDKSTNQPNVFYDASSSESGTAFWSIWVPAEGGRFLPKPDQIISLLALRAIYEYWFVDGHNETSGAGIKMLEPPFCSVWNWDARPFPAFPAFSNVWGDAGNWQAGNWLNGKGPFITPPLPDPLPGVPMPLNFPNLPGLAWSVHKRPTFSTRVASHVSGREVRAPFFSQSLYEFELTFDALDSGTAYPGLGAQSLQSLMGLYLQCQGQYGTFLFTDPTDKTVTGQAIGSGDGTRTAFTFQRTLGGAAEPASWVTSVGNVYLNGVAQTSGFALAVPNTLNFTTAPLGAPTSAQKLAEDSSTGQHRTNQSVASQTSGTVITFAIYVKTVERSAARIEFNNGSALEGCSFNLAAGTAGTPSSGITLAAINDVGGGWFQLLIKGAMAATAAPIFHVYIQNPFGTSSYAGTTGSGIYISGANWKAGAAAAAFLPAFSTVIGATLTTASIALPPAVAVTADFDYAFNCRFLDDQNDFEQIMNGLWQVQSLKFRSVKI